MADAHALRPGAEVLALRTAIVRRDHAALRAVHEETDPGPFLSQLVVERTDQVRTTDALVGADHFGVYRVIHQRGQRFAIGAEGLDDVAARIVKSIRVVVIRDLPFGFAGGDLEGR